MKLHHIKIIQKDIAKGEVWSSLGTEVFMDGKELKGIVRVEFDVNTKGFTFIKLEIIGSIEVEGNVEDNQLIIKPTGDKEKKQ